ncbi:hypothetical protein ACU686_04790 [Yinghuangia aomiensis]
MTAAARTSCSRRHPPPDPEPAKRPPRIHTSCPRHPDRARRAGADDAVPRPPAAQRQRPGEDRAAQQDRAGTTRRPATAAHAGEPDRRGPPHDAPPRPPPPLPPRPDQRSPGHRQRHDEDVGPEPRGHREAPWPPAP